MTFHSKEISVTNEEFGCTIKFKEDVTDIELELKKTFEELINSQETYILFQRTYAEDRFEKDYTYFESSDLDKSCELKNFVIHFHKTKLEMSLNREVYKVEFEVGDKKYEELSNALKIITKGMGKLIIY